MAKALSVKEPHASLIACGVKHIETRSWYTSYRGKLYIHASKTRWRIADFPEEVRNLAYEIAGNPVAFREGAMLCSCILADCVPMLDEFLEKMRENPTELALGYYSPGRYAWILEDVEPCWPNVRIPGHLGVWSFDEEVVFGEKR